MFAVVIKGAPGIPEEARKAPISLLHFIYLAQLPYASDRSIRALQAALQAFHRNKHIFVDSKDCSCIDFHGIPKFHSLEHYEKLIRSKGSPDGFNTEAPERLHIEFAKRAYRSTNKHEYTIQMVRWLRRQCGMNMEDSYQTWRASLLWKVRSKDDDVGGGTSFIPYLCIDSLAR